MNGLWVELSINRDGDIGYDSTEQMFANPLTTTLRDSLSLKCHTIREITYQIHSPTMFFAGILSGLGGLS